MTIEPQPSDLSNEIDDDDRDETREDLLWILGMMIISLFIGLAGVALAD